MLKIIPSILTNDLNEFKKILSVCEGVAGRVQIDVVDSVFANNKTLDPSLFSNLDLDLNLDFDFHLMTKDPINWVEKCAKAGASRIIAQIEMMDSQIDFVGKVQSLGLGMGLAIDLDTPVSELDPVILTNLDVVLIMTVKAGFGGQSLDKKVFQKIRELDEIRVRDATPFKICVDGGVNGNNISELRSAGIDEAAVGKRLFEGSLLDNIEKLTKAAYVRH